ncbi:major facilitator superfamily domain-containing protein [Coniella lustricola]|uniref:Major facilitator superfamily domain-containing protein n=1 Tax=Coniella lustricola TaxID=2025994 RepID=A0A2T3ALT8_9PEZI|nr:major facilitator superfamily domain-containing protein [Coniella lustricola]
MGLIISTPGVILPHLEAHYHLSDVRASLVFVVVPFGYLIGARLNNPFHRHLGRRGIALVALLCQMIFTGTAAGFHSPRPGGFLLFLAATVIGNVGTGLLDGSWCAWAAGLGGTRTNTMQGLLHGSFSTGAGWGPFLAASMFSVREMSWWTWYYVLLGAVVSQGLVTCLAFRRDDGKRYRVELEAVKRNEVAAPLALHQGESESVFAYAGVWTCAAYFLAYVGTEAAISGWIVTFMLRARHATPYLASLSSSGFWVGMAAGRFVLGFLTDKLGVRTATSAYLVIAILAQILGLAIRTSEVTMVIVTVVGFFLGPIFPSGIVAIAQILPRGRHVEAVSFVCSVGQVGAALLPFALGSLSQWLGIRVFEPFVLATLTMALLCWRWFPANAAATSPHVSTA